MLAEAYRRRSILLTGGTGFLGTALVEKILRSLPELGRLYLLIRASRDRSAAARFEKDVLGSAAFRKLREERGEDFSGYVAGKVCVLEGDVHAPPLGSKRKTSPSSHARLTSSSTPPPRSSSTLL